MFMELKALAALGTAELCLSRVQFQPGGCQRKLLQTATPRMSAAVEEPASRAGRGTRSQPRLQLNCGESASTKPCCLRHSSLKICFLSDLPHILPYIFYHSRSLPSPAKLIDYVLDQHPPLIFMSSGKLHPFPSALAGVSLCTHYDYSCGICPPTGKEALAHQDHLCVY